MIETPRDEQRQHINISNYAYNILDADTLAFTGTSNKTGLINTIISNSIDFSEASISLMIERYKDELYETFSGMSLLEIDSVVDRLLEQRILELKTKIKSYPKENTLKIRLRNNVYDMLHPSDDTYLEQEQYPNLGAYIKALLEDYSRKTFYAREEIFYLNTIETIKADLYTDSNKRLLQIVYETATGEIRKFVVKPYRLTLEHETTSVYLIGLSKPFGDEYAEYKAALLRISRIKSIKMYQKSYGSGKLTRKEVEHLKEIITKRGVYFLLNEEERIVVELTKEGKNRYHNVKHMRPVAIEYVNKEDGGARVTFNCTRTQIEYYFFRYGNEAYIESPIELREKFLRMYQEAADRYKQ